MKKLLTTLLVICATACATNELPETTIEDVVQASLENQTYDPQQPERNSQQIYEICDPTGCFTVVIACFEAAGTRCCWVQSTTRAGGPPPGPQGVSCEPIGPSSPNNPREEQ